MKFLAATLLLAAVVVAGAQPSAKTTKKQWIHRHPTVSVNTEGLPLASDEQQTFTPSVRIPGNTKVEGCGKVSASSKIVGGEIAAPHEFPWQVALYVSSRGSSWFCGGSIISDEWILTAAHCTDGATSVEVVAGAQKPSQIELTQVRHESTNFFEHPDWNTRNLHNDLALIKLPQKLPQTNAISPVCLPTRSSPDLHKGDMMTASGWGLTSDGIFAHVADELHKVTVPILDEAHCKPYFGASVTENTVCMDTTGGHGTCQGDSGGPLTWVENGKYVTRGITSFGSAAGCTKGYPAVDTNVKNYLDWIETSTGIITY